MKGMTNVFGELDIKDRWNLKIIKVEPHEVKVIRQLVWHML